MKIPIVVYRRTKFVDIKGQIEITGHVSPAMIRIGSCCLGTKDVYYGRTILQILGKLVVKGKVNIGRGSSLCIGKQGTLILGENFSITGSSTIICEKQILFGDDCLLSWDILIMDTDYHSIIDINGNTVNNANNITIGNHVWIGCRNTILKGVCIGDNTVIAANSTITKSITQKNVIVGGYNRIIKGIYTWSL